MNQKGILVFLITFLFTYLFCFVLFVFPAFVSPSFQLLLGEECSDYCYPDRGFPLSVSTNRCEKSLTIGEMIEPLIPNANLLFDIDEVSVCGEAMILNNIFGATVSFIISLLVFALYTIKTSLATRKTHYSS